MLALGAAEILLRLAGFGYPTTFFLEREFEGRAVLIDNQAFGKRFFPPGLTRYPRSIVLDRDKAPGARRIFVFGESAAMGDPDPKFGLPRMLEVLLQDRWSGSRVEVVNVSMVAINSHVVRTIARECAGRAGDLWVVYMGNNEMIGPFGSLGVLGAQVPPLALIRAGLLVKRTRVGQGLDAVVQRWRPGREAPAEWGGMTMMAGRHVRHDDPRTVRVRQHFARNLGALLDAGVEAGVPIVLCTVATNLKDCAPFASLNRAGWSAAEGERWQAAYAQGVAAASKQDWAGAVEAYAQAAALDPQHAELQFRWAELLLAMGRADEAHAHFRLARDYDALQFRTDGWLNELIRNAATARSSEGIHLLDAEALLAAESPQGIVGQEFLFEHVHLNPSGNYRLARAVAERAVRILGAGQPADPGRPGSSGAHRPGQGGAASGASEPKPDASATSWMSQTECFQRLGLADWNRFDQVTEILYRVGQPPFTQQANHIRHVQALNAELERARPGTKPAQVKRAVAVAAEAVAKRPEDPDLRWNLAQLQEVAGDLDAAEQQWRELARLHPHAVLPSFNLARLVDRRGRSEEAVSIYRRCLALDPDHFETRQELGSALAKRGAWNDSAAELRQAVRLKPHVLSVRLSLGRVLSQAGRRSEAEREFREVLRRDPQNQEARDNLQTVKPRSSP